MNTIPIFVRGGSILPLAEPVECVRAETVFDLTVHTFGDRCGPCRLWEDDFETFDFERGVQNVVELAWDQAGGPRVSRTGGYPRERYRVRGWAHH